MDDPVARQSPPPTCPPDVSPSCPLAALLQTCEQAGFDVRPANGGGLLCASAAFHQRGEGYFLSKRATLWAAESHEHLFIYRMARLTPPQWSDIRQDALERGMERIRPHDEHMVSYVSALVLCDELDAEAAEAVRRTRYSKSFWWGLRGWMRLRALVLRVPSSRPDGDPVLYTGNAAARGALLSLVQKALHPLFALSEYPK
ncbi:hypothetical protein [uncultured Desulfovibrio sp.]|uniref:hypothetical protein n=1 Tax=uncultured Desulfovibrio sp. TaxID=167968 RepID=UPI002619E7F6|nr:hypothetical protein [uncultured Desulfovibrio sp.]